jgi:serine/threonine protein kinase
MWVTLFSCGPAANESELKAFQHLKGRLLSEPGEDTWVLLTNLAFSVTHQLQSDEIDLIAIGPPGVRVIEVKHWTAQWFDSHKIQVEDEADKLTNKARKIGTTLRRSFGGLPRVDGAILLTPESSKVKRLADQRVRGVTFHTLNDWQAAIGFGGPQVLSSQQVVSLARVLQPRSSVAVDGSLKRLAGYVNLQLETPKDQLFHRAYKASHPARRDKVVLHLYDLSASDDKIAEAKAQREFEALHRLQLFPWAPRILDSYQEAPGYSGEMAFFTVVDPAAPTLADRAADKSWDTESRVAFGRNALKALMQLHAAGTEDEPIIHRNLNPQTILVKFDNSPILTGFELTRIPFEASVASASLPKGPHLVFIAPEVRAQGLPVADHRSDVYSLCASLTLLFQDQEDDLSRQAANVLARGTAVESSQRAALKDLEADLCVLLGEARRLPAPPPARFWTEDQIIRFHDSDYRIVSRLGSGGIGTAFKVVEIDQETQDELGTYVAKVAHDADSGRKALRAYSLARSHLRHSALSSIFEVANEWQENQLIALMTWISGAPLSDFTGVFPLLADEQQEASTESLGLRWLLSICEALGVLHRSGLVHGDVSPRNLIVSGGDLVLTDYDFVVKIGEKIGSPGTVIYCSPSYETGHPASPSDDIYALAASFFHVVFNKEPFRYGSELDKKRGLNWEGVNREEHRSLAAFLDKATHPDPSSRFSEIGAAVGSLRISREPHISAEPLDRKLEEPPLTFSAEQGATPVILREQRVDWLKSLLQSYPGSRWGNSETRGLDTEFAAQTYVETNLEQALVRDIRERRVRLVILCGNAGDGKTALLQHLAARLGLGEHKSAQRILEGHVPNGPVVRINLDGSASWQGRSADDILDEFLAPFQDGPPTEDIVHLLAINDGRLLEWIGSIERRLNTETSLTSSLYQLLQEEAATQHSYIRFVNLNKRSLVGGVTGDRTKIETGFLSRLLDQLYGGDIAAEIWTPCQTCSAKTRCEAFRAAQYFGPSRESTESEARPPSRARERLFEALQAVHLRGETHITMRELRAALVYVLFGTHFCDEYHSGSLGEALPYWDRAFSAASPYRQGELLKELARFDPALEAHPQIDRYLLNAPVADSGKTAPHYPDLSVDSARRRAFFEWTAEEAEQVAEDRDAIDLARGRHLRRFRRLPLADESELAELTKLLCKGISRLEDLPPEALNRTSLVPLRVTPRTPTETAFWVEKPIGAFRLETDLLSVEAEGVERLHRQAFLIYRYRTSGTEERLRLGAELFHLLLELAEGYQLGDVSTDDTFAHLSIFVQRLVREDERILLAWNPMRDDAIYQILSENRQADSGLQQRMIVKSIA